MTVATSHEPVQIIQHLNDLSSTLGRLGVELANIDTDLETAASAYDEFVENFKAGLWEKHLAGELKRMPAEDIRVALAHRAMPTDLLGSYKRLKGRKSRCEAAISRTKAQIEAKRSVLSALKEGLV